MKTPTEQRSRELFAADAEAAPPGVDLIDGTLRRVHHHRRARSAGVAALVCTVVAIGVIAASGTVGDRPQRSPIAAPTDPAGQTAPRGAGSASVPPGDGALGGGTVADCVESYSPEAVAGRSFAFDGTITAIGPARSNRPDPALPLAGVTFQVNEWFRGGSGGSVTVDMEVPASASNDPLPAYGVGSRLLVSGEPRWGGAPLDDAIAWSCGFTRYYDTETAAAWETATR